jgi:hypothetical protein
VRKNGEEIELAFDEAESPLRWRKVFEVAESAYAGSY